MKLKIMRYFSVLVILVTTLTLGNLNAQELITPEKHFGFVPGTDRMLFVYNDLIEYLQKADKQSDKIKLVEIGQSPLGKKMYVAFISSAENIARLDELKEINKELAINPNIEGSKRDEMISKGKVFVMATLSMHSNEVGPSQAAPLMVYELLTSKDKELTSALNDVVFMLVPSHNPDGMDMVVENYKKYKGTKYEGTRLPGIYHKYVGHDNNRDFVTLSQTDTKAIASAYNTEWYPQVLVEKHQMWDSGVRYFVPPMHDPIAVNIDEGVWNWIKIFGAHMIKDMTDDNLAGVSQNYLFDDYWPGSTETCLWKNVIGMLTEAASVQCASPNYVEPNEINVIGKGLGEHKKGINLPLPWKGGWWRLSDIVDYEISSMFSIIRTAGENRKSILTFRNDICKKMVEKGASEAPYYYILPELQHDQSELVTLVKLLQEHGVDVFKLTDDINIEHQAFLKGDIVIPLAQSYRTFIKEVLEKQNFPERHYTPNGELIKPYDITSWSLPLHRGLESYEINTSNTEVKNKIEKVGEDYTLKSKVSDSYKQLILTANNNSSYKIVFQALSSNIKVERLDAPLIYNDKEIPAGSFIIDKNAKTNKLIEQLNVTPVFADTKIKAKTTSLSLPRIALVETWYHDMDAGWTRFLFDSYDIPYKVLHPEDFATADFGKNFDIIVFPSVSKSVLMEGKYKEGGAPLSYPPEYTKGIGKKGLKKLMTFVNNGGNVLSWGNSTNLFTGVLSATSDGKDEEFKLPVDDMSADLKSKKIYVPGSFVRLKLRQNHPLTYGMKAETGVFYRGKPVFKTKIPIFDMDRRVIATFPEKDILMSGYGKNQEYLANKSAMVWLKKGKGQIVLYAFNPQFRASTNGSYKLLFNGLLIGK